MQFLLTVIIGAAVGYVFLKGKIPGGMMVGALVGAVVLNISTDMAARWVLDCTLHRHLCRVRSTRLRISCHRLQLLQHICSTFLFTSSICLTC